MFRSIILAVLLVFLTTPLRAACDGRDLIADLSALERAEITARAEAAPFPRGNFWRAERDGSVIHVVGTFHIGDPRLSPIMRDIAPLVAAADLVLVEVTPEEEARLAAAMAEDPSLAFLTEGPTLRDLLGESDWARYAAEMTARGIPTFLASRFRPWLAFTTLSIPVCATGAEAAALRGLDDRIITYAGELSVPVQGLEGYEVIHRLFDLFGNDEALDILRATLAQAELSEDMFATLAGAYFNGEHRLIWEFSRSWLPDSARALFPPERASDLFDRLEAALLVQRNRDWLDVLLPLAEGRTVLLAVGAAHLSGDDGVLRLLEEAGYRLDPLEF
jgi:uncharacterized protein